MKYYIKARRDWDLDSAYYIKYILYQKRLFWFDKLLFESNNKDAVKNQLEEILYIESFIDDIQRKKYMEDSYFKTDL